MDIGLKELFHIGVEERVNIGVEEPTWRSGAHRCVSADPHHGDEWTSVSKDMRCLRWSTEQIVRKVADNMALGKYQPEALEKIG